MGERPTPEPRQPGLTTNGPGDPYAPRPPGTPSTRAYVSRP
ncbi:hypothetical protein [Streptomyces phaeochromogenes]|nr:hypothetical protein [Streptomyces phaeochromogenes]